MKAIIIGGGIGGLTAAIALARCGIQAEIYERAPELREVGAGITLWANALGALDALGISRDSIQHAPIGSQGGIRTPDGRLIFAASYDTLTHRFGAALVAIHRADLLAVLKSRVRDDRLHLGRECVGFDQNEKSVHAKFADGGTASADLLVGADGLRSVVCAQLFDSTRPRYAGYVAWRCVVKAPREPIVEGETWGPGKRFGIVPLTDGRVYWFAAHNEPEGGSDAAAGSKRVLLELFKGWHSPIEALIAASGDGAIIRSDIFDRAPLPRWSVGRATLLGDAAHPMTPNLGQGACQAIEDGVELAALLAGSTNVAESLDRYERRRLNRTSKVVTQSRRIGAMAQWGNPILCAARNALLRAMPRGTTERQIEWLVGYRPITPPAT